MAKGSATKSGSSRIRFIMLEADLNDGDLSQVTQAIQNALRPAPSSQRIIQIPADGKNGSPEEIETYDLDIEDESDDSIVSNGRPKSSRSKPRVSKTPTVLDEIDVTTAPSLKEFVADYETTSNFDKYLVIALWFRDARKIPAITADHAYTCFRLLKWSTATTDFVKPMQNLKSEQSFKGGAKEGFSLTLTGAGKIEAKKRNS